MTTLTVNIPNQNDLPLLQEILNRFGLTCTNDPENEFPFSKKDIEGLLKSKKDFLEGKTTARNWDDIEEDLNSAYN